MKFENVSWKELFRQYKSSIIFAYTCIMFSVQYGVIASLNVLQNLCIAQGLLDCLLLIIGFLAGVMLAEWTCARIHNGDYVRSLIAQRFKELERQAIEVENKIIIQTAQNIANKGE